MGYQRVVITNADATAALHLSRKRVLYKCDNKGPINTNVTSYSNFSNVQRVLNSHCEQGQVLSFLILLVFGLGKENEDVQVQS